jgi:hypothetical protein
MASPTSAVRILRSSENDQATVIFERGQPPDWKNPLALLIHGYNVAPHEATQAFSNLFASVSRESWLPPLLTDRSVLVCWEGYASGGLSNGRNWLSPLTYPDQIPSARLAAIALRNYIDSNSHISPTITIIAHSLGCRFALELLDSFATVPGPRAPTFPMVCLMAAAVPVYLLTSSPRLRAAVGLPKHVLVLFSESDTVLTRWFPIGQTFAREGFFPKAVGLSGEPVRTWGRTAETVNDHGDYFLDTRDTAPEIAQALGHRVSMRLPTKRDRGTVHFPSAVDLPYIRLPTRFVREE